MSGNAALTGNGSIDPVGDGWLRLTDKSTYQTGYVYYNKSIPANQGLIIDFDYASWGGNGADGISFFLFDGTTTTFNIGANGGSLGYAQKCGINGLSGGYLGIGLDEFGNYTNPNECRVGGPGYQPDTVAIRGPGSLLTGYAYIARSSRLTAGIDTPTVAKRPSQTSDRYRHVTIIIEPVGLSSRITVKMTLGYGTTPVTVIPATLISSTSPATLKFGFAASTGGNTNYHEIRNLEIQAKGLDISATKTVTDLNGGNVEPGDILQYSVAIKNTSDHTISRIEFSDSIPANTTYYPDSVSIPAGSTLVSETPNVVVNGLSIPSLSQANITFKVRIDSPLGNGTTISNQAIINFDADGNGTNETTINTDGDLSTSGEQPTIITVRSGPVFAQTTKQVTLTDMNGNSAASPGDVLTYSIVLNNSGNANAVNTHFTDNIPMKTTYNTGTASASSGFPTYHSSANTLEWAGNINAGSQVVITFSVTINTSGVQIRDVISNQGQLLYDSDGNGDNDATQLTDSDLFQPGVQPTEIMIGGRPEGIAIKSAEDINGGNLEPGDFILYTISMQNLSSYDSNGMEFIDNIPNYTILVPNSISKPTGSTIISTSPTLDIQGINIPSHSSLNLSFQVQIAGTLPAGVTQIENQGIIYYDTNNDGINDASQLTDGETTIAGNQLSILRLTAGANFSSSNKTVDIFSDKDGNGVVSPGDLLRYILKIDNSGNQDADVESLTDTIPNELTYLDGSLSSTPTIPAPSFDTSTNQIQWTGSVPARSTVTIQYLATIKPSLLPGTVINNQGEISSGSELYYTDGDLSEPGSQPTSITLGGQPQGLAIKTATDLNGGNLEPGDIIRYDIQLNNSSSYDALNMEFSDSIPNYCDYEIGSLSVPSGTVVVSETPLISVQGIDVLARSIVNLSFKVKVRDTVPAGVNAISNQGLIYFDSDGNGSNDAFQNTDGDTSVSGNQPTILSLQAGAIFINSSKSVGQFSDADGNGFVSPGDILQYTLVIRNTGNQDAIGVSLQDLLPGQITIDLGSIVTNPSSPAASYTGGKVIWGGDIPAGSTVTIGYQAEVNSGLTTGTLIQNQGSIFHAGDTILTDGDLSEPGSQPTEVTLGGMPQGMAVKSAIDLNGGNLEPGDLIRYEVVFKNESNYDSLNMEFNDSAPASTKIIPSSVSSPSGTVVVATESNLRISGIDVLASTQVSITFNVQVNSSIPSGVSEISNQGVIYYDSDGNGNNDSSQLTDGDLALDGFQPTLIKIIAGSNLENSSKEVALAIDSDGNGLVSPGDTLEYIVRLSNQGNQDSVSLKMIDSIPTHTSYISGSGSASAGSITFDSTEGEILWEGVSLVGTEVTIQYRVLIDLGLNPGVIITNQGFIFEAISNEFVTATDGDLNSPGKQTTDAVIGGSVAGFAIKTVVDKNGGNLEPGEVLVYYLKFKNTTTYPALGLEFSDVIPAYTSYVEGSLIPPSGESVVIVSTSPTLRITGIDVPENSELDFSFEVQLDAVIPAGITHISNQGLVAYDSNGDGTNDATQQTDSDLTLVGYQSTFIPIVNIFDPPSGYKSVNGQGYPVLVWRQVWINDGNAASEIVRIVDSIPTGTTYSENSLTCVANGVSVVYSCEYQPGDDQVVFTGIIGSDPGAVNENQAHNEVVIEFNSLVNPGTLTAQNQGHGYWDQNGDGTVDTNDNNVLLDQFVVTDNIGDSLLLNPTIWNYVINKSNEPKSPETGFAPNKFIILPPQPSVKRYSDLSVMHIEIPKIGINKTIVGIPLVDNNWDLTWLSDQVGYLNGSGYPTWAGNSYLTGHLTLPNGKPGPMYRLNELSWGDKIIIHAWGQRYTFEVREKSIVDTNADFEFVHKELPWITLVTCKDYDESNGRYRNRLIVSAVLIIISE